MIKYKIEKGIPIPAGKGRGPARKYPFPDMVIGDSILDTIATTINTSLIVDAAQVWGRKNGPCFVARRTEDGVRIWRTE